MPRQGLLCQWRPAQSVTCARWLFTCHFAGDLVSKSDWQESPWKAQMSWDTGRNVNASMCSVDWARRAAVGHNKMREIEYHDTRHLSTGRFLCHDSGAALLMAETVQRHPPLCPSVTGVVCM